MKEFISLIKGLLENKRTRALAILLIYFIFFILVFALINNSNNTVPVIDNPLEQMKEKSVYKLEFIGNDSFVYSDNVIIYNNEVYGIDNMPEQLLSYDISIFKPINLYNLLKSSTLESTNYVEKTDTYIISCNDFERIIYNNIVECDSNIRITISQNDINYIYVDLIEHYGYKVKIDLRS